MEEDRMAKRGGFPGGGMPGNMNNLMKQAQRMQWKDSITEQRTSCPGSAQIHHMLG